MRVSRSLLGGALLGLFSVAAPVRSQTSCAPTTSTDETLFPANTGGMGGVLAMPAGGGQYVYVMTQYGIARASLADPAHPGPIVLAQIGHKAEGGKDNGGALPANPALCDCYQGPKTIDAAEAGDGSARMISDFDPRFGGYSAVVASADSKNTMAFGQQVAISAVPGGSRVAALFLPSGKWMGYYPFYNSSSSQGVAVVDVSAVNGNPAKGGALNPLTTLAWNPAGGYILLRSGKAGGKYLLAGYVQTQSKIRIAEVDSSSGVPTETSSISSVGGVGALSLASVDGRTFIFSAEGTSGIQIYEYANGSLSHLSSSLPGNFREVVVTGGVFPLIFGANVVSQGSSYIDVYDTNWVTQGGSPRQAAHLQHTGSPENFLQYGFQALVSGTKAFVYRPAVPNATHVATLYTVALDISCISISPNSPPVANATATNLSAAGRQGAERLINYYGDKWEMQDNSASSSAPPANGLNQIAWDWNYNGPFTPDAGWQPLPNGSLTDVKPVYFPCSPDHGGTLATGAGCPASVSVITANPPTGTYSFALQTSNDNGPSNVFVSPAIQVVAPQAIIAGFSNGVLQVLSGQGIADASGSQGNINDAATKFAWTFNPGNITASTKVVNPVPALATSFSLTITYPGGYTATQSGNITQVDLVPDFTPSSGSVTAGGSLTITNAMKAGAITVSSADYNWDGASFAPLPSKFTAVGDQAAVPSPAGTTGNHTLTVRFNYLKGGQQLTATASHVFAVTTALSLQVTGPTSGQAGQNLTFGATVNGGSGSGFLYSWCFESCLGGFGTFTTPSAADSSKSHAFKTAGSQTIIVNVTGGGTGTATKSVSITGTTGGGGGGNPTASLSGPTTGAVGSPITFAAGASGGTAPYSFAWRWGDNSLADYAPGPQTNSYTYAAAGTYSVSVEVTDHAGKTAFKNQSISIGGGGPRTPSPNGNFTVVSGATVNPFNGRYEGQANVPITLTAAETNAATYAWDFGDGTTGSGRTVSKSFSKTGSFTVSLTVTGDDTSTAGTASSSIKIAIGAEQFTGVVVPDASAVVTDDGAWKTDITLTNSGAGDITVTPIYRSYDSLVPTAPATGIDVTTLGYESATKYTIPAGGSLSQADVVGFLGGTGKGDLFFKTDGGIPEIAARVYFVPTDTTLGAYGNSIAAFQVGALGQVGLQQARALSPQTLLGLRSDDQFRFKLKLYNSSGALNAFHVEAFDETGAAVSVKDPLSGNPLPSLDVTVGAYQAAEFADDALGLNDPTHRYVLKASPSTSGALLIASASVIDRTTNDQVRLADDATHPSPEGNVVRTYVPGVSRFDTSIAHWRTSVAVLNSATVVRGVLVEYIYGPGQTAQYFQAMNPGELVTFNDIAELFPNVPDIAAATGTAGLLRVSYPPDSQTATNPVLVSARAYDDRSTTTGGTAGTALSSFAAADAITVGDAPIVIPGAELDDLFRTNVGFFALDDESTVVKVTAVDQNGNVVGEVPAIPLNGASGPWAQMPVSLIPNIPSEPFSLWIEVLSGGRIGTYAINIDQKSSDTTFIKGTR